MRSAAKTRLILEINIRELSAAAVLYDKAGVVEFFDGPGRREAAGEHHLRNSSGSLAIFAAIRRALPDVRL